MTTALPKPEEQINFRSLDVLRGLLAVYVVFHHARWFLWTGHANWTQGDHAWWADVLAHASAVFRNGHEAVIVFFVLSGFFIHYRAARKFAEGKHPAIGVKEFFTRRWHRLAAPYYFALLVTVGLDLLGRWLYPPLYGAKVDDETLNMAMGKATFGFDSILSALLLLPKSLGLNFGSNAPLWSLAYEVVFYAMYPVWLWVRRRSAWLAYGGAVGVGVAAWALAKAGFWNGAPLRVPPLLTHFEPLRILFTQCSVWLAETIGGLPREVRVFVKQFLCAVLYHWPIWIAGAALVEVLLLRRFAAWWRWVLLAGAVAGFAAWHVVKGPAKIPVNMFYSTCIVALVALLPKAWESCRLHRFWEEQGVRSYSIYIMHMPAIALGSAVVYHFFGKRPEHGWFAVLGGFAAWGLCNALFWACERHFLHARVQQNPEAALKKE